MKRIDILFGIGVFAFLATFVALFCSVYWAYGLMLLVGIVLLCIVVVFQKVYESHNLTKRT